MSVILKYGYIEKICLLYLKNENNIDSTSSPFAECEKHRDI